MNGNTLRHVPATGIILEGNALTAGDMKALALADVGKPAQFIWLICKKWLKLKMSKIYFAYLVSCEV